MKKFLIFKRKLLYLFTTSNVLWKTFSGNLVFVKLLVFILK